MRQNNIIHALTPCSYYDDDSTVINRKPIQSSSFAINVFHGVLLELKVFLLLSGFNWAIIIINITVGIGIAFRVMDDDNTKTLDLSEFTKGLKSYGVYFDDPKVRVLHSIHGVYFDDPKVRVLHSIHGVYFDDPKVGSFMHNHVYVHDC
jgi:hypothetical protein